MRPARVSVGIDHCLEHPAALLKRFLGYALWRCDGADDRVLTLLFGDRRFG
jgi:hypothetical protein